MILDIAMGLLIAIGVGSVVGSDSRLLMLFFGVLSTISVDIDFLIYLRKNGWKLDKFTYEHRDILHSPVFFSLGGGLLVLIMLGKSWSMLWVLGTMYHFVHDTLDSGFGIRWLYPFNGTYFTLVTYSPQKTFRDKEEQRRVADEYGNSEWMKEELRVRPRLILELTLLIISVVSGIFWVI